MKKSLKNQLKSIYLLLVILIAGSQFSFAQKYATIYIQGDMETPIYVKVEGKMMERLASDYFIIPHLDAGYTKVEVLFQQNKYPAQEFLIAIPSSGIRGFVLQRINSQTFGLYDIEQKRIIKANNKKEDDWLLDRYASNISNEEESNDRTNDLTFNEVNAKQNASSSLPEFNPNKDEKAKKNKSSQKVDEKPVHEELASKENKKVKDINKPEKKQKESVVEDQKVVKENKEKKNAEQDADQRKGISAKKVIEKVKDKLTEPQEGAVQDESNNLVFIDDVTLNKRDSKGSQAKSSKKVEKIMEEKVSTDLEEEVASSDCTKAMSNLVFENLALVYSSRSSDDEKMKYFKRIYEKRCFTTEQIRILGNDMNSYSLRLQMLEMAYERTSDKENYPKLAELFPTQFLKDKFMEFLK